MLAIATGAKLAPNAEMGHRLDQLVALGTPAVRTSIGWAQCEPQPGQFQWTKADTLLDAIAGRGLKVCLLLQGRMDGHALDPDHIAGYATFVRAATDRYHDPALVLGYENQNEIMLGTKYDTNPTPARYVPLQQAFYEACKTSSDLPVGTSARIGNAGWLAACYKAGIKDHFDFATEHPYTRPLSPTESMQQRHGGWWAMHLDRQAMVANGDSHKTIWATEYGSNTGGTQARTEQQQSDDLEDAAHRFATNPHLEHLFWFDGWDTSPQSQDQGDWMGLYDAQGNEKPACATFRQFASTPV